MSFKDKTTRSFMVITENDEHLYNIIVSEANEYGRKYELLSSNNAIWAEPYKDKVLLTMIDTGNGFTFDRDLKKVEYDMGLYVRLLLTFDSKTFSSSEDKFKIIEDTAILEI